MIQELGYSQNLPRMRNLVTECSDEISLLTKIAQDQFQAEPEYEYEERTPGAENVEQLARFGVIMKFNDNAVSFAYGETKQKSK